jgi:Protein of unknown function (DUF402)
VTWRAGDAIALREVWLGRVWSALPATVVEDSPTQRAMYVRPGSPLMIPIGADGNELRIPVSDWTLGRRPVTRRLLSFAWPDRAYAVMAFWDGDDFMNWYINLQTPLTPTTIGFDFVDHLLDVIVAPDRASWHWKDEDELAEGIELGVFSPADAEAFRAAGLQAVEHLTGGAPPFDRDWTSWRPDPSWREPELPDGWDRAPG